ncbi:MAG: hypothetical protein ABIK92_06635 [Pseudomonadota bacterium]
MVADEKNNTWAVLMRKASECSNNEPEECKLNVFNSVKEEKAEQQNSTEIINSKRSFNGFAEQLSVKSDKRKYLSETDAVDHNSSYVFDSEKHTSKFLWLLKSLIIYFFVPLLVCIILVMIVKYYIRDDNKILTNISENSASTQVDLELLNKDKADNSEEEINTEHVIKNPVNDILKGDANKNSLTPLPYGYIKKDFNLIAQRKSDSYLLDSNIVAVFYHKDLKMAIDNRMAIIDDNREKLNARRLLSFERGDKEDKILDEMIFTVTQKEVDSKINDIEKLKVILGAKSIDNDEIKFIKKEIEEKTINHSIFCKIALENFSVSENTVTKRINQYSKNFIYQQEFSDWALKKYGTISNFRKIVRLNIAEETYMKLLKQESKDFETAMKNIKMDFIVNRKKDTLN